MLRNNNETVLSDTKIFAGGHVAWPQGFDILIFETDKVPQKILFYMPKWGYWATSPMGLSNLLSVTEWIDGVKTDAE